MSSKNKEEKKSKKKNKDSKTLITIKYLEENGKKYLDFKLDDSVKPNEYLTVIYSLFNDDAITAACKVLESNGHAGAENTVSMTIAARYLNAMNSILEKPVEQQEQQEQQNNDEEIIKPSRGIVHE